MKTRLIRKIRSQLHISHKFGYWYISDIDCTYPTLFISDNTKQTIQFICKILNIKLKRQQQNKLNRCVKAHH